MLTAALLLVPALASISSISSISSTARAEDAAPPAHPSAAPAAPDERALCIENHVNAQVHRRDGKLGAARAALLTCSRSVCPPAIRSDCADWLAEVEKSSPSVVLAARSPRGDEASGRVLVDGAVVATRLDGQPIEIDPGAHLFRFEVPPYDPVEQRVVIRTGEKNREVLVTVGTPQAPPVALPPSPPPPVEEHRPVPAAAYGLGAGALAGLVVFAGLGGSGLALRSSLSTSCAPFCSSAQVQPVRTRFLAADVSLGVAVASAAAAIVVFVRRPAVPAEVAPAPRITWLSLQPTTTGPLLGLHGEL